MEAAERIFDGSFDHIADVDEDVEMVPAERTQQKPRMMVRAALPIPPLSSRALVPIYASRPLMTMTMMWKSWVAKMRTMTVRDFVP